MKHKLLVVALVVALFACVRAQNSDANFGQLIELRDEFTFATQLRSEYVPELQRSSSGSLLLTGWEFPANIVDDARTYADQRYVIGESTLPRLTTENGKPLSDCSEDDRGKLKSWVKNGNLVAALPYTNGVVRLVVTRGDKTIVSRDLMKLEKEWVTSLRMTAKWYCEAGSAFYVVRASPKDANRVLLVKFEEVGK